MRHFLHGIVGGGAAVWSGLAAASPAPPPMPLRWSLASVATRTAAPLRTWRGDDVRVARTDRAETKPSSALALISGGYRERIRHLDVRDGPQSLRFTAARAARTLPLTASPGAGRASAAMASVDYSLGVGPHDLLQMGVQSSSQRANPELVANALRAISVNTTTLSIGWRHDERLSVAAGWVGARLSGKPRTGPGVEAITGGTPTEESGAQILASYALGEASPVRLTLSAGALRPSAPEIARAYPQDHRGLVGLDWRF